ncbi:ABC transporter ATP-binding protein/permease [Candidatus Pelagibacter sp.]|nr:ABC transporter ATP-binding protein/permease [Candidatus Pelagibacter sp.]
MLSSIKQIPKFLPNNLKIKLLINFFFLILIPFLEVISIGSIGAVVLFVIDLEKYLHLIPDFLVKNYLEDLDKVQILYFVGFFMFLTILIKNIFLLYYAFFENTLRRSIAGYHSKLLFSNFINESYLEHTMTSSSEKQNDILNQSSKCSDFIFYLMTFIKEFLIAIILVISLLIFNLKASLSLITLSLVLSLIFYLFSGKKVKRVGEIAKEKESALIEIVKNTFNGFKIIILYGKKNFYEKKFNETILSKYKYEIWQQTIQKIPRLFFELVFAGTIIFILISFVKIEDDIKNILSFLVFLSLISIRLLPIFVNLNVVLSSLKYYERPVEDLFKVLSEKKVFSSKKINKNNHKFQNINSIEIKNLSFDYKNKNLQILDDISFKLNLGNIYAFAGKTGAGKSTLLDLITGILEPSNGSVLVNGLGISNNIENWQSNVGYVPQDNFLLNDSILKNICFLDENPDLQKFNKAIEQAELKEFINSLPDKEKTIVGDQGLRISGGQKQRLGLARSLYEKKTLLAFDEATSALDNETEYNILKTLGKLKKEKIIIIIAHRETTINYCDAALYLPSGKILSKNDK